MVPFCALFKCVRRTIVFPASVVGRSCLESGFCGPIVVFNRVLSVFRLYRLTESFPITKSVVPIAMRGKSPGRVWVIQAAA